MVSKTLNNEIVNIEITKTNMFNEKILEKNQDFQ